MMNIDANNIQKAFYAVEKELSSHGISPLDGYVIDDGWNNYYKTASGALIKTNFQTESLMPATLLKASRKRIRTLAWTERRI